MGQKFRVGAVPFLNARPLLFGIEQGLGADRIDLSYALPSALADRMAEGGLDVALLPTIELARIPDLVVFPGLAITSRGPAGSVLLVSKRPIEDVRSVALDPDSRTSNALARVLFAEKWERRPAFAQGSPDLTLCLHNHDAAVRIGDKALFEPLPPGTWATDLGEEWSSWTRFPFVFAVWAARMESVDRELYEILHASRREGNRMLDAIALDYTWNGRQYPEKSKDYLTRRIFYRFGSNELDGLRAFLAATHRIGLIESIPEVRIAAFMPTTCHDIAAARGLLKT